MKIGEARRTDRRLMIGSRSQAYLGVTFITTKVINKTKLKFLILLNLGFIGLNNTSKSGTF